MKKKILFRADADTKIGYGHFVRTLALAEMLKDDFECVFYTQEPTEYQIREVTSVCKLIALPSDDTKFELFLSDLTGNEIVFLDNYFFTEEYEKSIKKKGCKLVSIGSNNRHYCADVVINYTDLKPSDFSVESYTKFCLGLDWSILRGSFYLNNLIKQENIVICIGGTDQFCFSEKFYDAIKKWYPIFRIQIISTDRIGEKRIESLRNKDVDLLLNISAIQMANAFASAKISLVSASGVAIEALSQASNVIVGHYMENQINIYKTLDREGYIWPIGDFSSDNCLHAMIDAIGTILAGNSKRRFCAKNTIFKYKELFQNI